jgi:hypothetical protein
MTALLKIISNFVWDGKALLKRAWPKIGSSPEGKYENFSPMVGRPIGR